jgi:hypothetical protein
MRKSLWVALTIITILVWKTKECNPFSEDFSIWIASKEDLIISKLWWAKDSHSEQQLRDVKNLIGAGCDREYVKRWTSELGLTTLWQECNS